MFKIDNYRDFADIKNCHSYPTKYVIEINVVKKNHLMGDGWHIK